MKTLLTLSTLALISMPVWAEPSRAGQHRMPDGIWMANHDTTKPASSSPTAVKVSQHRVVARVNGLVCDFCAQSIRKTLSKEPGVREVQVDLSAKTVSIDLSGGATLERDRLGNLLREAGYDMTAYEVR